MKLALEQLKDLRARITPGEYFVCACDSGLRQIGVRHPGLGHEIWIGEFYEDHSDVEQAEQDANAEAAALLPALLDALIERTEALRVIEHNFCAAYLQNAGETATHHDLVDEIRLIGATARAALGLNAPALEILRRHEMNKQTGPYFEIVYGKQKFRYTSARKARRKAREIWQAEGWVPEITERNDMGARTGTLRYDPSEKREISAGMLGVLLRERPRSNNL